MKYDVADLIGLNFYAKTDVGVKRTALDSEPFAYLVDTGQKIGTLHSWLDPKGNERKALYWMFLDAAGQPYYVPHEKGIIDLDRLVSQGVLSDEDKARLEAEANKNPLVETAKDLFMKFLIAWGVVQLGKEYLKN